MPNCMDFIEVMFGAALIGAVPVPSTPASRGRELAYVTENADLKVLVTSDIIDQFTDYVVILHDCLPGLAEAADPANLDLDVAPELKAVVLLGSTSPAGMVDRAVFEALADHATDDEVELLRTPGGHPQRSPHDLHLGTTAEPKGCPLNHESLVRTAVTACRTRFELTDTDVFWDPLPLFHMSSILPLIGCLDAGSSYVTITHFDPAEAIAQMRDEKATVCFSTFPPVTQAMINHPDWDSDEFQRIRLMNNVAPPDALRAIHALLPSARHMNAYGLTECGGVVAFSGPEDPPETWAVSSGRPFRASRSRSRTLRPEKP